MSKQFPKEHWKRKVILVLDECDVEQCRLDAKGERLLNSNEITIVEWPDVANDINKTFNNLLSNNLIYTGAVLVQSPYAHDVYKEVKHAPENFACDKYFYFYHFCQLLGAKSFQIEVIQSKSDKSKSSLNIAAGKRGIVKGESKMQNQKLEYMRSSLNLKSTFEGGKPEFEKAEELLTNQVFANDSLFSHLFESCQAKNKHLEQHITLNLSSESKHNLDILLNLNIPAYVNIDSSFETERKIRREYSMDLLIEF